MVKSRQRDGRAQDHVGWHKQRKAYLIRQSQAVDDGDDEKKSQGICCNGTVVAAIRSIVTTEN